MTDEILVFNFVIIVLQFNSQGHLWSFVIDSTFTEISMPLRTAGILQIDD